MQPKPDLKTARRITRRDAIWIIPGVIALGFFGWLGWRGFKIVFLKARVSAPTWKEGPALEVASTTELTAPWQFKYFDYSYKGAVLKSVLIRLSEPVIGGVTLGEAHYLALSRICTHMGCTVNFVDNPELGSIAYNYRTDHPFLGCPCHFGAYEPLQAGQAVFGPPRYPLARLRLEVRGSQLWVTGHESPLRPLETS